MPADTRLNFKEMCARFEVTPRTLRHYEYIELLAPEKQARSRFYTPREVGRMKLIMRGRRFGFSLEEIRQWLLMYENPGNQNQMQVWLDHAGRQIEVLENQRDELSATIDTLKKLRQQTQENLT